jgi:hypothetical protein
MMLVNFQITGGSALFDTTVRKMKRSKERGLLEPEYMHREKVRIENSPLSWQITPNSS